MENLQEYFNELSSNDEARYFYHFTSVSGDKIMDEGLIVANPSWEQSFLEFSPEELLNIEDVINDNQGNKFKNNNTMIIVGVYKDDIDYFIRKLSPDEISYIGFEGVSLPDYIVDTNYILGYIDLNTLELYINEYANIYYDNLNLR